MSNLKFVIGLVTLSLSTACLASEHSDAWATLDNRLNTSIQKGFAKQDLEEATESLSKVLSAKGCLGPEGAAIDKGNCKLVIGLIENFKVIHGAVEELNRRRTIAVSIRKELSSDIDRPIAIYQRYDQDNAKALALIAEIDKKMNLSVLRSEQFPLIKTKSTLSDALNEDSFENLKSLIAAKIDAKKKVLADADKDSKDVITKCESYEREVSDLQKKMSSFTDHENLQKIESDNKKDKGLKEIKAAMDKVGRKLNLLLLDPKWKGCPSNISIN